MLLIRIIQESYDYIKCFDIKCKIFQKVHLVDLCNERLNR